MSKPRRPRRLPKGAVPLPTGGYALVGKPRHGIQIISEHREDIDVEALAIVVWELAQRLTEEEFKKRNRDT